MLPKPCQGDGEAEEEAEGDAAEDAEDEAVGDAVRGPVVSNGGAGAVCSAVWAGGSDVPEGTAGASYRGESVAESVTAAATAASVQTGASAAASPASGHRDNLPRRT